MNVLRMEGWSGVAAVDVAGSAPAGAPGVGIMKMFDTYKAFGPAGPCYLVKRNAPRKGPHPKFINFTAMSFEQQPRAKKYDEPLKVKGGFLDIIKVCVKQAENNAKKKAGE